MKRKTALLAALLISPLAFILPQKAQAGEYCREYTRTIYIGGRAENGYGTACMQPDGDWKVELQSGSGEMAQNSYTYYTQDLNAAPVYIQSAPVIVRPAPVIVQRRPSISFRFVSYDPRPTYRWNGRSYYGHYDRHDRHGDHRHDGRHR